MAQPTSASTCDLLADFNRIDGRLALVTGASGGIGAAIAKRLALNNVHLALTYNSNKSSIDTLVTEIRSLSSVSSAIRISVHKLDAKNRDELTALPAQIKEAHDGNDVDILISNAAYGKKIQQIWDVSIEEWDLMMDVNLTASFLLVKGLVEPMKAQKWGRIVFVSSIAASGTTVNGCHYSASKGGLTSLMKNLSVRLAPWGITANDVAPAGIKDTGMIPDEGVIPKGILDNILLGRLGEPSEVASVVEMFVTTGYCTGQSLLLSGGLK